ncbi:guanine nucleotide-binding protein-like NSN1 [Salvia divinorum]|uniref:Guanine nucleotide-binding protein-like NSN1 n=1 Tax=Salvia divinorum TaxID=28513 RepID=A0ABD1H585_SALDI
MQEVHLDKKVKLLDSPGVMMLKSAANEKLDDPIGPVKDILKLCPDKALSGGVDVDATARVILHDWNEGKIPYHTMPPKRNADEPSSARIVTELGKEFNVDEVYGSETTFIGNLKSMNDFNPVEVPSNSPLNLDMVMLEDKEAPQGNDDQTMESGEDEQGDAKEKSATVRQNEQGMLNTKRRKADEKRRKKDNNQPSTMEHDGNDDYDFKVDYVKESATET